MRIDQVLTGVTAPARAVATAQRWLVGQLLNIGVIGRIDESSMRLTVDGREVVARTPLDLAPGATYTARVTVAGSRPQLSIVEPQAAQPTSSPALGTATLALRSAITATLPTQEPLNTVLTTLQTHAANLDMPPPIQARLATLTATLPDLPTLTQPAALGRAVTDAGPLLEASLAASVDEPSPQLPTQDLKLQLLGLRQAIDVQLRDQSPPLLPTRTGHDGPPGAAIDDGLKLAQSNLRALAANVDAGVARITTHQLQHLTAAEHGAFFAFAEIPFRTPAGVDTIALAIDGEEASRRRDGTEEGGGGVALNLAIPLDCLGELRARIGLCGDRLAVTLWSEAPGLREMIVDGIDDLEARLTAIGFELTPIAIREVDAPDPLRHLPARLVDTSI